MPIPSIPTPAMRSYNNANTIHYGGYAGLARRAVVLQTEMLLTNLGKFRLAPAISVVRPPPHAWLPAPWRLRAAPRLCIWNGGQPAPR